MLVLGIETSCDETGVALYDPDEGLLADALHSQVAMHASYGGVVPELASRDHVRYLLPLIHRVLHQAGRSLASLDAIAYTAGPGLAGALLVGSAVAESLAMALDIPALGIHHLEGHLLSPLLSDQRPEFPFVALLVSGGHTQFMSVSGLGQYSLLGETVDDAAGEAFDKTAHLLGLSYPGGPALSRLAESGDPSRFSLPRPMMHSPDLHMSFSGLKTAVSLLVQSQPESERPHIAASFEQAVSDLLCHKAARALSATQMRRLVVAGGVGANRRLRRELLAFLEPRGIQVTFPPPQLCTDNGAMIAFAGALRLTQGGTPKNRRGFSIHPRWPLEDYARSWATEA